MKRHERAKSDQTTKRAHVPRTVRQYSENEKIAAVTASLSISRDHPLSNDAVAAARAVLNTRLDTSTLHDWLKLYKDRVLALLPPQQTTIEIVTETRDNVLRSWSAVESIYLERLKDPAVAKLVSARDAAVVSGIARDHIDNLTSVSPDIVNLIGELERACYGSEYTISELLKDMVEAVKFRKAQSLLPTTVDGSVLPDNGR